MDIRIGAYRLTAGSKDFTISEVKVNADKDSKNLGKEYDTDMTYHPSLESALNNVLKRGLLKSDTTTLWELLKELQASRAELKEMFNQLV